MEIYQVLPKGERNNFVDPEEDLRSQLRQPDSAIMKENSLGIPCVGSLIMDTLRKFKLTTVKNLVAKAHDRFKAIALGEVTSDYFITRFCLLKLEVFDEYALAAIKHFANGGFLKLNVAERFEDSEIVQYHATAAPDFRDGKFQL